MNKGTGWEPRTGNAAVCVQAAGASMKIGHWETGKAGPAGVGFGRNRKNMSQKTYKERSEGEVYAFAGKRLRQNRIEVCRRRFFFARRSRWFLCRIIEKG